MVKSEERVEILKMVKGKSACRWMIMMIFCSLCVKRKVGFADEKDPECSEGSKHVAKGLLGGKHQTKKQDIQGIHS